MGFEDIKWDKSDRERQILLWSHFYVESIKAKLRCSNGNIGISWIFTLSHGYIISTAANGIISSGKLPKSRLSNSYVSGKWGKKPTLKQVGEVKILSYHKPHPLHREPWIGRKLKIWRFFLILILFLLSSFGASVILQSVKICLQCRRPGFYSWVGEIPWRRKWQPTLVFSPGEYHGQRSPVGYSPWGHKSRTQLSDWTTTTTLKNEGFERRIGHPSF